MESCNLLFWKEPLEVTPCPNCGQLEQVYPVKFWVSSGWPFHTLSRPVFNYSLFNSRVPYLHVIVVGDVDAPRFVCTYAVPYNALTHVPECTSQAGIHASEVGVLPCCTLHWSPASWSAGPCTLQEGCCALWPGQMRWCCQRGDFWQCQTGFWLMLFPLQGLSHWYRLSYFFFILLFKRTPLFQTFLCVSDVIRLSSWFSTWPVLGRYPVRQFFIFESHTKIPIFTFIIWAIMPRMSLADPPTVSPASLSNGPTVFLVFLLFLMFLQ